MKEFQNQKHFYTEHYQVLLSQIGAIITILLTSIVTPILPYLLSFAAGAMIYVVVEELIPESQAGEHSNIGNDWCSNRFCYNDDIRCCTWID